MGYVGRILSVIYTFVLCTLIACSYAWNITTVFGNDTAQVASCIVVIITYIFLIILCSPLPCIRTPEEEQLSIQTFHINQGFIAVTSVIANVLLPVVMLLGPKNVSSIIICLFIYCLLVDQLIGFAVEMIHFASPIQYTFPKTIKLSNPQKYTILAFSVIMEFYHFYMCCWNISSNLWPINILLCTAINIMEIPAIIVAFYAYNSDRTHFSRVKPGVGLELIEIRKWDTKARTWKINESPDEHEVLHV